MVGTNVSPGFINSVSLCGVKAAHIRQLRARRPGRDAVALQEGKVERLLAGRVQITETKRALQAVNSESGTPISRVTTGRVDKGPNPGGYSWNSMNADPAASGR